ncbi:efflux RND transporter periplasmic adaptor subunit [bacterium]|jgi:multidrug efflux pump subunit AcrA (membrane-fusion protein)|nr:efflux RND transporter periplasmic adaptor subunit [bacterium]
MTYRLNSGFSKYTPLTVGIVLTALVFSLVSCGKNKTGERSREKKEMSSEEKILYYTCGMHPSVRVSPEEYDKGEVNCPICNMKLVPIFKEEEADTSYYGCGMEGEEHVFMIQEIEGMSKCPVCGMPLKKLTKEEADKLTGVVSRVKVKGEQARLAGVKTDSVKKMHLYKEIRTVGTVAYDPELAIAQEEFISSLKASEKIEAGKISEIKERAANLVESSKKKLKFLGLSNEQIDELARTGEIQTGLIMPEKKMWVYGDVYEYELSWVKKGSKVKVTASSLPGETFYGVISGVNPVLDPKTRSVRFRAEIENPELMLKPRMYVDVVMQNMYMGPGGEHLVLAIPKSAVLNTGTRKIIWIDKQNGEYEGRLVEIGPEATAAVEEKEGKFYPVIKGVSEGELVVTEANFLIDSQSQISGIAASAYGGSLESEETKAPPIHQH